MWDLQVWYAEWEMSGRYEGLTGVVNRMGDEWEICGRYVGLIGVVCRMGDKWEICGTYRCGIQNGR